MQTSKLDSKWKLYYFPQTKREASPEELVGKPCVEAVVPGNVELDLIRADLLPEDLYKDENVRLTEQFERYEWWYETTFTMPKTQGKTYLYFEGVDCLAEYWLDGVYMGESDNMLIPFKLEVPHPVEGKTYQLRVRLRSVVLEADKYRFDMLTVVHDWNQRIIESLPIRKARHTYGWDIMPRIVSAGIWKDVYVLSETAYDFSQCAYFTESVCEKQAKLTFFYELNASVKNCEIEIVGECGDSHFEAKQEILFKAGRVQLTVEDPKLWYPKNYGEPNLYHTTVRVTQGGKVMSEQALNVGIRTAELRRTDVTDGKNGDFAFYVNGIRISVYGTNWIPLDAFHSREKERYAQALALLDDIGCNMVRWWGGNVYPEDLFYDFCDSHGILVWQDFAMACGTYPQDEVFAAKMAKEVEAVVCRYRNHPSLVLWAGDNECDEMTWSKTKLTENKLTRAVLPDIIARNDMTRDYLPSSPYIAKGQSMLNVSERHLWGPRDYYKSPYYKETPAHFVSELGYHACPAPSSVKKFISGSIDVPKMKENRSCLLHSTDCNYDAKRFMLMEKQVRQLFGEIPDTLTEFSLASQISQAEADKFYIELFRCNKPVKSGVLWWNLIDGWPQFSDAVVDYYGQKKLAYYYIKACQEPVCVMLGEMVDWMHPLVISNDTLIPAHVEYRVLDVDDGAVLKEGATTVEPNGIKTVDQIMMYYSDKKMIRIEYTVNGVSKVNHYLAGFPPFSFEQYKVWLDKIGYTDWKDCVR